MPLPGGKVLHLGPKKTGQIADGAAEHPALVKLIEAGTIELQGAGETGGTDAAGAHPLAGFVPPPDRSYRVVALVSGAGTGALAIGADRVIQLPFDPASFTAEMLELAGRG